MSELGALRDGEETGAALKEHVASCPICLSRLAAAKTLAARLLDPRPNDFDHPGEETLVAYGAWLLARRPEEQRWTTVVAHVNRCWECRELLVAMPAPDADASSSEYSVAANPADLRRAEELLLALTASDPSDHP